MVNPLRPRKYQDMRVPGLLWILIGLPRISNGVAPKLKGSLNYSQEEMSGAMLDWRSRFSVSSV